MEMFHVEQEVVPSSAETSLPDAVLRFESMLREENTRQNLVSRTLGPAELRNRLILPCWRFAALPAVAKASTVVDIGSGGGLPGILVALRHPGHVVHLVDSQQKKCRFLSRCADELGLDLAVVHASRIEELQIDPPDLFCARFVADLSRLEKWTRHLRKPGGRLLVFKGVDERAPLRLRNLRLESRHPIDSDKQVLGYVGI